MKILFCAQTSTLHAARWINQFADTGWDLHVFENVAPGHGVCPELRCGHVHTAYPRNLPKGVSGSSVLSRSLPARLALRIGRTPGPALVARANAGYLSRLLRDLRPDVVHVLGLGVNWVDQSATLMQVRERLGGSLPAPLLYSSWGTDLEVFAADPEHRGASERFVKSADYLITECDRDRRLAAGLGFAGTYLGKLPAFGGTDVASLERHRRAGQVSDRRVILLKGRDHAAPGGDPVGRALTALRAMALCSDALRGYRMLVIQATPAVAEEAIALSAAEGLDIRVMQRMPYAHLMRLAGAARVAVALTVNDGLPSFLVEAMALGALPLHSDLEPVREWIKDGVNGLLVSPEDVHATAAALRRAVSDDDLVNSAAATNRDLVGERLDYAGVRTRAMEMYRRVAARA